MQFVSDLFREEPKQWGLRGDQYLWRELRAKYADVEAPATVQELQKLLEDAFWEATGESLTFCFEVWIERFSHGGMSSGLVCGDFWRSRGFPLVLRRFSSTEPR